MSLSVYRIEDGEKHWVIAESEREALELLKSAHMIDDYATVDDYTEAEQPRIIALSDAETIKLSSDESGEPEARTASDWCARMGKGLLGSTVF